LKLAEYLVEKGIRQAELARHFDVSQPTVHNWIYSKALPSGQHMVDIYKWSKGKVNLKDWMEQHEQK